MFAGGAVAGRDQLQAVEPVAHPLVDGEDAVSSLHNEAIPNARLRRLPRPPQRRIALCAGLLALLDRGELVGAANGAAGAFQRQRLRKRVVRWCCAGAKSHHQVAGEGHQGGVPGQTDREPVALPGLGLKGELRNRCRARAAGRERGQRCQRVAAECGEAQGELHGRFVLDDATENGVPDEFEIVAARPPGELAIRFRLPAPPSGAHARLGRFVRLDRRVVEVEPARLRWPDDRLGVGEVVVRRTVPSGRRPSQAVVSAAKERVFGRHGDVVLVAGARREGRVPCRGAGHQPGGSDVVADESQRAQVSAIDGEAPIPAGWRCPPIPDAGRDALLPDRVQVKVLTNQFAGFQSGALVVALGRRFVAKRDGVGKVVVRRRATRAPAQLDR